MVYAVRMMNTTPKEKTMTTDEIMQKVEAMTARELDALITGTTRFGESQAEQLTAWNLAIDEETRRS